MAVGVLTQSASAESYTWKNVEMVGGGFVPGIIFNETEPNLVYARTDMGGAYRMDPVTKRWIPMTDWIGWDDWNLTGIASLATDPVETNRVYLAAGTYTNDFSTQNGAILRSTDKGATWCAAICPSSSAATCPEEAAASAWRSIPTTTMSSTWPPPRQRPVEEHRRRQFMVAGDQLHGSGRVLRQPHRPQ